ncbi:thiamine pyrophosphate-dependent dehydrogenase E1 component subunit alpha [Nocardiopsis trehalosi]|jgi:pyruvate dehydrogenase E1 component alpha subunit|uniref:thiamine pyrophosphate-dependent dehydrogenase E1 component subunit alpha n=1 Tax=Nocardiopsis trehalosi TaxID=109329 RepID=UPI00082C029E|nr:thiamine pyrophosphate-dependent dehydrogenase E1 component subunit alpha [Nocardiopsis trehalosi]
MDVPTGSTTDLPADLGRRLYRDMLTARRLDGEAIALQRQGVFPAYVSLRGQEAAQVGSAAAVDRDRDFVFPTYREMAVALTLGVDMVGYMASHRALWHGGLYDPMASRFAPINAVVGGPVPHAVGWALGERLRGTGGCAVSYFGDGASSEGDVHESLNFAGVFAAPVVFVCQNNQWALSVPNERQVAGGSVAARAQGYGMPGVRVDGNDPAAVYTATRAALDHARAGGGPTLIEAVTYRLEPHSTSDDPSRYRDAAEERAWRERDPLPRLRARLEAAGHADAAFFEQAEADARATAERVRDGVAAAPEPGGADLFTHVYREPTRELARQRRAWQEEVEL